jgi:hypothetical protein
MTGFNVSKNAVRTSAYERLGFFNDINEATVEIAMLVWLIHFARLYLNINHLYCVFGDYFSVFYSPMFPITKGGSPLTGTAT